MGLAFLALLDILDAYAPLALRDRLLHSPLRFRCFSASGLVEKPHSLTGVIGISDSDPRL